MSNTDNFGYGQMTPWDTSHEFNVTCFIVKQMIARMDTMKLVQVVAVNAGQGGTPAAAGTVNVQPLVNQLDGVGNKVPHGVVNGIPWYRLAAGNWAIVCDPMVGDIGYVICSDRDISSVKSTQAQANPGSRRRYNIADGIYVGGVLMGAPMQYIEMNPDGTLKIVDGKGNVLQTSSNGFAITGKVAINGDVAVTGKITATGNITAGQGGADLVTLQQHIHSNTNVPPTPGH